MDAYLEQIVIRRKTPKDLWIKVGMILSIFAVLALGVAFGILINYYFIMIGFFLSLFEIYLCWYVVTGRYIEYEYIVTNNNLQIDKIMNASRRKELLSVDIRKIESFEKLGDGRLDENRCDKVMWLGTHKDDENQYRFVVQTNRYGKVMVVFAPNKKMLEAIKLHLKPEVKIALVKSGK